MSLHRTIAILRKEMRHIFRDLRLLFLVTLSPAFLLFMFSYVFALDLQQVTIAVMDQDRSRLSREYLAALTADGDVRVVADVESYRQADWLLTIGLADAVLVIPPGFERDAQEKSGAPVQVLVDGAEATMARQAIHELTARTNAFAWTLSGTNPAASLSLEVRSRVLYNPSLESLVSMVPGLLGIFLTMPALALMLALTREKEMGTFETLIATPVRGLEYLLGKLTAYLGTGLISALIAQAVAIFWFHVPFQGEIAVFLAVTIIFFGASMGLSLVLANFIRNQQTAMLVMLLVSFVPSFFLSGLIHPIDTSSMRSVLISNSLPTTHFIAIGRGVFLKGLSIPQLIHPVLALLAMGLIALVLGVSLFRKQVD
ncbi:MAG: ABC transporter permease [Anaerolineae bacterium]|nr:ABC transporter permease [Anaerolineae bacterium]MDW8098010.1 ABC transporter permease [Anaerolineae bacterium]